MPFSVAIFVYDEVFIQIYFYLSKLWLIADKAIKFELHSNVKTLKIIVGLLSST